MQIENMKEIETFLFDSLKYYKADIQHLLKYEKDFILERAKELNIKNIDVYLKNYECFYRKKHYGKSNNCKSIKFLPENKIFESISEFAKIMNWRVSKARYMMKKKPENYMFVQGNISM